MPNSNPTPSGGIWSNLLTRIRGLTRPVLVANDPIDITVGAEESLYAPPETLSVESFLQSTPHVFPAGPDGPLLSVSANALMEMVTHAESDFVQEQGGICLGRVHESTDDGQLMVSVVEAITSRRTGCFVHRPESLTFTIDAWRMMIHEASKDYPELRLLGWYHTHPGMSVFLSAADLFIHNHFFPQAWQIAMVLDPVQRSIGAFCRVGTPEKQALGARLMQWDWQLALRSAVPEDRVAADNESTLLAEGTEVP